MSERDITLPDVGEGVAEAEGVEVPVKVGDPVREGDVLAAVMTDKATVEIPSPAEGRVAWIGTSIGEKIAAGSVIVKLDVADGTAPARKSETSLRPKAAPASRASHDATEPKTADVPHTPQPAPETARPREPVRSAAPSPVAAKPTD